jgi:CheY-like chemotaxis protein
MRSAPRIILIDDDADEAELLLEALQTVLPSVSFQAFTDGHDALRFISVKPVPDIIFLDLNMPLLSGKEILQKLRKEEVTNKVRVIIYSTSIGKRDMQDTEGYNVTNYLQKPEDFKTLCARIADIFNTWRND